MSRLIYKIVDQQVWQEAQDRGQFLGAAIDLDDGYIHFSTAGQVAETAKKHFAGQTDLLLVAIDAEPLAATLRWEPSRGGELFPHLYGALDLQHVSWESPLAWDGAQHIFPEAFGENMPE